MRKSFGISAWAVLLVLSVALGGCKEEESGPPLVNGGPEYVVDERDDQGNLTEQIILQKTETDFTVQTVGETSPKIWGTVSIAASGLVNLTVTHSENPEDPVPMELYGVEVWGSVLLFVMEDDYNASAGGYTDMVVGRVLGGACLTPASDDLIFMDGAQLDPTESEYGVVSLGAPSGSGDAEIFVDGVSIDSDYAAPGGPVLMGEVTCNGDGTMTLDDGGGNTETIEAITGGLYVAGGPFIVPVPATSPDAAVFSASDYLGLVQEEIDLGGGDVRMVTNFVKATGNADGTWLGAMITNLATGTTDPDTVTLNLGAESAVNGLWDAGTVSTDDARWMVHTINSQHIVFGTIWTDEDGSNAVDAGDKMSTLFMFEQ